MIRVENWKDVVVMLVADVLRNMLLRDVHRVAEGIPLRLRELRESRGLSLVQLARHTGLSSSALSRLENGKQVVTADILLRLARDYRLSVDFILGAGAIEMKVYSAPVRDGESTWTLPAESYSFRHPVKQVIAARRSEPLFHKHHGEEWIFVSRGPVHVEVGPDDLWVGEGESVEIDGGLPHRIVNLEQEDAVILRRFSPDGYTDHLRTEFSEFRDEAGHRKRAQRQAAALRRAVAADREKSWREDGISPGS